MRIGVVGSLTRMAPKYARLLRSQYASASALEALSQARLERALRAASQIPFYRERIGVAGVGSLRDFPILKRADIPELNRSSREHVGAGAHFTQESSSGSTGMPVEFLFDDSHQSGRYAARIRYLRANGWHPLRRNAWIVAYTAGADDESLDARLADSRWRMRSVFPKIFRPFEEQVNDLISIQPEFLYTMPSNLDGLLAVFEHRTCNIAALKLIFTGGEVVEDSLRERARRVLGVEIRDNYGSTEGFIAWQCPAASYHINAEHILTEIVDEMGNPVASGQMGRVLITTLENYLMPLVRYEIGDFAVASHDKCSCGRTLPVMGKVIGRGINLFRLPNGVLKSPWPLVGPLKAHRELRQFQIVQESHHHYRVRYVSDREMTPETQRSIEAAFGTTLDLKLAVAFERTDSIPRTSGGKFMTALSLVDR